MQPSGLDVTLPSRLGRSLLPWAAGSLGTAGGHPPSPCSVGPRPHPLTSSLASLHGLVTQRMVEGQLCFYFHSLVTHTKGVGRSQKEKEKVRGTEW